MKEALETSKIQVRHYINLVEITIIKEFPNELARMKKLNAALLDISEESSLDKIIFTYNRYSKFANEIVRKMYFIIALASTTMPPWLPPDTSDVVENMSKALNDLKIQPFIEDKKLGKKLLYFNREIFYSSLIVVPLSSIITALFAAEFYLLQEYCNALNKVQVVWGRD